MKQNIEIEVPAGFEAKYDPETMLVKIIRKDDKPRSWEEYLAQNPYTSGRYWYNEYTHRTTQVPDHLSACRGDNHIRYFSSKEECNAFIALAQLRQLREAWIDGWKPDWNTTTTVKYVIICQYGEFISTVQYYTSAAMSFPTEEMANEFLNCFKDLLEIAKPLI